MSRTVFIVCAGCNKPITTIRCLWDDYECRYFHDIKCLRIKQTREEERVHG